MLQHILDWRLDAIAFAAIILIMAGAVHYWLRRSHGLCGLPLAQWLILLALIVGGAALAEYAGSGERDRLREMVEGVAPTYAQEFQRLGHDRIGPDTPPDDPLYQKLIQAQIRWEKVNTQVSDIYTFRQTGEGQVALIVDSETDYDANGRFEGEREQRTAIGEPYPEVTPNMLLALTGQACFDDVPVTDRWGTWVSAYVPLYDANGKVEAVLGVDYDARNWLGALLRTRAGALALVLVAEILLLAAGGVVQATRAELTRRIAAEREKDRLQRELLDASRRAGMADIATGVLHNVGNALNSVNVSASLMTEKLRKSKAPGLGRAVAMLQDNQQDLGLFLTSDEKGRRLPGYLSQLADTLKGEQEEMLQELSLLARSVEHIKQVVASQQQHARASSVIESYQPGEVLEEALRMNALALDRHGIQVERRFGPCLPTCGDSHRVLQILVNLIANAKKALAGVDSKKITLTLEQGGTRENPTAVMSVCDTGIGIAPENQAKLFTHGFTTWTDGHGFGLHSAAIAAKQMGATLTAASDGPGRGACFTLEVPLAAQEVSV